MERVAFRDSLNRDWQQGKARGAVASNVCVGGGGCPCGSVDQQVCIRQAENLRFVLTACMSGPGKCWATLPDPKTATGGRLPLAQVCHKDGKVGCPLSCTEISETVQDARQSVLLVLDQCGLVILHMASPLA